MDAIVTLVAAPSPSSHPARLDQTVVERLRVALAAWRPGQTDVFAAGRAADIPVLGDPWDMGLADAIRAALAGIPVDYALQPAAPRAKRLLLADMDSTIVTGETLDEMAAIAGIGEQVKAITARAMNGELDFHAAIRERVGLLAGRDAGILEAAYATIEVTPGAEALVRGMRANGACCRLVSGGFRFFTSRIAERVGFHGDQANDIEIQDGRLTGRVIDPILDSGAKVAALERHAAELGVEMAATLAVGDGANDLAMLNRAGLGVAWRAKPTVAAAARARVD
ncbi:MAG: phosphoserine phosphatase SerB, partial [Alphaproteobacteria bacterium]